MELFKYEAALNKSRYLIVDEKEKTCEINWGCFWTIRSLQDFEV